MTQDLVARRLPLPEDDLQCLPFGSVIRSTDNAPVHISSGDRMYLRSGNNSLAKAFADDLNVLREHHVHEIHEDGTLVFSKGTDVPQSNQYDAIISTAPLPQSSTMFNGATPHEWSKCFAPNITVVLEYDTDSLGKTAQEFATNRHAPLYAQYHSSQDPLVWSACENVKEGRKIAPGKSVFVLQASDLFSAAQFDDSSEPEGEQKVIQQLTDCFEDAWKISSKARTAAFVKRWRYARIKSDSVQQDVTHVETPAPCVVFCGDGVAKRSRIEHAIFNGFHAARKIGSILSLGDIFSWELL